MKVRLVVCSSLVCFVKQLAKVTSVNVLCESQHQCSRWLAVSAMMSSACLNPKPLSKCYYQINPCDPFFLLSGMCHLFVTCYCG